MEVRKKAKFQLIVYKVRPKNDCGMFGLLQLKIEFWIGLTKNVKFKYSKED